MSRLRRVHILLRRASAEAKAGRLSKPVLILTGGTGLIGSRLIPLLIEHYDVHAICRQKPDNCAGVNWHVMDLAQPVDARALPQRVDAIVYLAQSSHFREFPEKAPDIFAVNTAAVIAFLEYARGAGAKSFILASSGGVYGPHDGRLTEDLDITTRSDIGFYLGTKLCSEILTEQYATQLAVVMMRFFFVYGEGQTSHMLLPRLIRSVRDGTPITLSGAEGISINPTYVDDAARAILSALSLKQSHRINVGGPEVVSLRRLAEMIGERVGQRPRFTEVENDAAQDLVADISKMSSLLATPTVGLRDGLERLIRGEPQK